MKRAVALRYEQTRDKAPRVVAKGTGDVAKRMIEVAQESKVVLHEDPKLADLLMKLDLDSVIPEELYQAVAEVLAFVYRSSNRT